MRKVIETQAALGEQSKRMKERIYIGEYEIFRKFDGNDVTLERQTLGVMDDEWCIVLMEISIHGKTPDTPKELIRYQFENRLGFVSFELDKDDQIVSYEEYASYDAIIYRICQMKIPKRFRYIGKEQDSENGLYYYGARYYSALIDRWVSCDPNGIEDGLNVYLYVDCNPATLIDSNGRVKYNRPAGRPHVIHKVASLRRPGDQRSKKEKRAYLSAKIISPSIMFLIFNLVVPVMSNATRTTIGRGRLKIFTSSSFVISPISTLPISSIGATMGDFFMDYRN